MLRRNSEQFQARTNTYEASSRTDAMYSQMRYFDQEIFVREDSLKSLGRWHCALLGPPYTRCDFITYERQNLVIYKFYENICDNIVNA